MDMMQLGILTRKYGGSLHGECKLGTDIEFPNIAKSVNFLDVMGWTGDAFILVPVSDFTSPVVVTVPNQAVKYWGTDEHLDEYLRRDNA